MRRSGLRQAVNVMDANFKSSLGDPLEEIGSPPVELFRVADIVPQIGPREEQRSLLAQKKRVDFTNGSTRLAEAHHEAARMKTVETFLESGFANRVVHNVDASVTGEALDFFGEVAFGVDNDVIRAMISGELRFFFCRDGSDHGSARNFCDLQEQETHTAGCGMNQAGVAGLENERGMRQVMRRHSLQHNGRTVFEGNGLRQFYQRGVWDDGILGIRAAREGICDALPNRPIHPFADRLHRARSFISELHRRFGRFVKAAAEVNVDEVYADGFDFDEDLSFAGLRLGKVHVFQIFRTTGGIGNDSLHEPIITCTRATRDLHAHHAARPASGLLKQPN